MLVLTAKDGDQLALVDRESGLPIAVLSMQRDGARTRVSVDAPEEVRVMREEVLGRALTARGLNRRGPGRWGIGHDSCTTMEALRHAAGEA